MQFSCIGSNLALFLLPVSFIVKEMLGHKHVEQSACVTCKQALWTTSECIKQPLVKQKQTALLWINSTGLEEKRNHLLNLSCSIS